MELDNLAIGSSLELTTDMMLVMALVGFTMVMLMLEKLRPDVTALIVLVALGLLGLVPSGQLFGGFAGNAVISIIATMVLGAGLDRTGALNRLSVWLLRVSKGIEERLILLASLMAGLVSSVMQNPPWPRCSCRWPRGCRREPASPCRGCCCPSAWPS